MASTALRHASRSMTHEERAIRVEDYINDKLQTYADLESLDALLENVQNQQTLLRKQLYEAEASHQQASHGLDAHSRDLARRIESFGKQQATIDRQLLIVTQSETSDDAVRKFADTIMKLQRLDVANGYVSLLEEVERLSSETRNHFRDSPQIALRPYLRVRNLANALKKAQPAAEDAAPHLVDHVHRMSQALWQQMKDAFAVEFQEALIAMRWPRKDLGLSGQLEQEWTFGVEKLLELQEPELKAQDEETEEGQTRKAPSVLLPLEVMLKPLELRFKYHFYGDRPTNRPDKPEYFLSHIDGLLSTYDEFLAIYLQPVLNRHFMGSNLALNTCYIDSTSAFINALLPMVREKVFALLPKISTQPQLLSHLIHELMDFDIRLRDDWGYDGGCGADGWKGLTWEVLVQRHWFGSWLKVENDFALSRYQDILDSSERGEIDYDSVDPGITKPTKAAVRVNDLLETITDRYRPLTSFSQKVRFLIDIQITIFDKFRDRLHASLVTYLTMTSSIARTVQGVTKEEQARLQGLGGLESLCRVYGSAEYLEKKMQDWNDDVFFIELYDEIQFRIRKNVGSGMKLAGDMSVQDVAERTSSAIASEEESGALFDETAGHYRRLRIRAESLVQDMLIHNIRESLRPYSRINPWSSLASDLVGSSSLAVTAELDNTIQQLSSYLSFLYKVLAEAPLRRISRQVLLSVQSFLWDNVLMRNNFSAAGAAQFARDLLGIWQISDKYVGIGQGELGMKKLSEALSLLTIPATAELDETTSDAEVHNQEEVPAKLGIWQVEERIFRSNESAREVLEELGLEVLTESEARNVLERRIELGN